MIRIHIDQNTILHNTSLQAGDDVYYSIVTNNVGSTPIHVGKVLRVESSSVIVEQVVIPPDNSFLMFRKSNQANQASLSGYFAEVTFKNNSTDHAEMFSVSSHVVPSSK